MKRLLCLACWLASYAATGAAAPTAAGGLSTVSVDTIMDKHVAARGGLDAWRAVNTLTLSGRMEGGGQENPDLPFVMKMKRPRKGRMEIRFEDETAVQVYDGNQGWKFRPFLGRDDVEPYTADEAREATAWEELDGPLLDCARKGTKVSLLGTEILEGHNTYKLKLTMKGGDERKVWIDAATFLERRMDGEPRKVDGRLRSVSVYYRDFRKEDGLMMPHVFETVVEGNRQPYKMYVEEVAVNEPMDEALFLKPDPAMVRASVAQARHRP